ncbi:meiotic recombination protein REC8 homolog [Parasteatoda tepidariorum]|uniref:meiotic recombination protein REC8 homolog n=1 Tax=Parasteatoda tepidariorum TaxID=114398 RepID=UPI0039BC3513
MFYPSDILKKRGKFGVIWLASTKAKRLHRRQICSVDIVEASEDIINVINTHNLAGMTRKVYFSLYLSSQLVSGLIYIADMQTRYLLEDLKAIVFKLSDSKLPSIDLNRTLNKSKVTLKELNMSDAPFDFGCLDPSPEPSHHVYDYSQYFLITTPKSSSEGSSPQLGQSIFEVPREGEKSYLARKEDITLADAPPFESEEPIPELEEDLFALPFLLPSTQPESVDPLERDSTTLQYDIEKPILAEEPVEQQRDTSLLQTPGSPPEQMDGFVLPPAVPDDGRRRKRKRQLVVDAVTSLTGDQIKKNILSANKNLTTPLVKPSTLESAKSLMTRLGSGSLVPKLILGRFKRLKTLPQLEEDEVSGEESDELIRPVRRRISVSESVEHEREKTRDRSASGFLKSASIGTLEASSTLSATARTIRAEENVRSPPQSHQEEDYEILYSDLEPAIAEARFSMPLVDIDTPGPVTDTQQPERRSHRMPEECFVSPERTPPPPSPPPMSEILDEAYELIKETAGASIIPNVTTFSAVLKKTHATKKRVASLFNSLLSLHAEGKIIVQQPMAGAEIFIEL